MTRLISGRIHKVDSANVSADRYQFIDVSEAEPDLGIPNAGGQVVASNTSGGRYWVTLNTANVTESSNNLYFTNARVDARINASLTSANVVGLTTANVTEAASNLYYTNARVDAHVDPKLTTANVAELTNLYYTNARVSAHIDDVITTSNIDEGVNLYYTNARVRSTLSGGTGVSYNDVTGVIDIGQNVFPNASVSFGNVIVTGNLSVLGNIAVFETNTLAITDPLIQLGKNPVGDVVDLGFFGHYVDGVERHAGLFRDASDGQFKLFANLDPEPLNVVDTANASYRNANLVVNYIIGKVTDISNHTTTDLAEGTNLYYTNARARTSVSAGEGISYDNTTGVISANLSTSITAVLPYLTTANVTEAVSNLYYTNARVDAHVDPKLTTANVAELTNLYFTNTRARDALVDANITVGNLVISGDLQVQGNAVYLNTATLAIEDKNIIIANGAPNAAAADGAGITIEGANANIQYSNAGDKITVNKNFEISGNLTLSSSPNSNISGINTLTADAIVANIWTNLYTANVKESASNLYYTDARVVEAVNNFITTGNIDESAEGINLYYTNARVNAWVQPFLTTANVKESESNLYFTNTRVVNALIAGNNITIEANGRISSSSQADVASITSANTFVVQDGVLAYNVGQTIGLARNILVINEGLVQIANVDYTVANSNVVFTSQPAVGNNVEVRFIGTSSGNLISLTGLNTSQITEVDNLYYTNTRVASFVDPKLTTANTNELNNLYYTNARVDAQVNPKLTTANVTELNNLYYTNTRVASFVDPKLTTANVTELTNLYYTNARARTAISAGTGITYDNVTGIITANVVSTYGDSNAIAAINPYLTTANVTELNNLYYTNARVNAFVQPFLTTANVIETSSNLYFTNARVVGALIAGTSITIESNGRISSAASGTGSDFHPFLLFTG